jgi:hypothetical protein
MVNAVLNGVRLDLSLDLIEEYQARGVKLKVVDVECLRNSEKGDDKAVKPKRRRKGSK